MASKPPGDPARMTDSQRFKVKRIFRFGWYGLLFIFLVVALGAKNIGTLVASCMAIVGQFALLFWFMGRGGIETYKPGDVQTRFSDVWGQDPVVEKVRENILFLQQPEVIEARGGYVPGGILLWGPPGTGKTLLAEAVAGETGKPYVFVTPGAFTSMFMGVGVLKVKSLYRKLRKLALEHGGVVVFFDEADSLGSRGLKNAGVTGSSSGGVDGCRGISYMDPRSQSLSSRSAALNGATGDNGERRRWRDGAVMGMNGDGATLQALLAEMSGLKKPRGLGNRIRRMIGAQPKPPPKYRILTIMATNMSDALDEALLRPGRIDRMYRVGYPSKDGRKRTYTGYFDKVRHSLTPGDIDKLAAMTPYATGATMKDLVNESLINAIRNHREIVTWQDVATARRLEQLGPPEGVEYIDRERHATALHEACHAVAAYRLRMHMVIDIATIEKSSNFLGMVASIPPEDQFTTWRSEYEADIIVALASLAGERMFFDGDNSSGVMGDLDTATRIAAFMEGHWGMGSSVASHDVLHKLGIGGGQVAAKTTSDTPSTSPAESAVLGARIERKLSDLLEQATALLRENRRHILAVTHALETYKTISGDDVAAVIEGRVGPLVDGRPYALPEFLAEAEAFHAQAVTAHVNHERIPVAMPVFASNHVSNN